MPRELSLCLCADFPSDIFLMLSSYRESRPKALLSPSWGIWSYCTHLMAEDHTWEKFIDIKSHWIQKDSAEGNVQDFRVASTFYPLTLLWLLILLQTRGQSLLSISMRMERACMSSFRLGSAGITCNPGSLQYLEGPCAFGLPLLTIFLNWFCFFQVINAVTISVFQASPRCLSPCNSQICIVAWFMTFPLIRPSTTDCFCLILFLVFVLPRCTKVP